MDLSVLTSTIVDTAGVGSVPIANFAPLETRQPLTCGANDRPVGPTDRATPDNSAIDTPQKVPDKPKQDFDKTLEQQIRKDSPQDDKPASEIRSDRKESSNAGQSEKSQEPGNEMPSESPQAAVQASTNRPSSPVSAKADQAASARAGLNSVLATNPKSAPKQLKQPELAAAKGNVPEKAENAPGIKQVPVEAKQPLQKTDTATVSVEKDVSVPLKAAAPQITKDSTQQSQTPANSSTANAAQTTDQSQTPKANAQEIAGKGGDMVRPEGTDAKPRIQQPKAQQQTDNLAAEKQSNSTGSKADLHDAKSSDHPDTEGQRSENKTNVPVENPTVQRAAVTAAQTPASQTIKQDRVVSKDGAESGPEQVGPQGGTPTTGTGRPSSAAQVARPEGGDPTSNESAAVTRQIQESFSTAVRQGDQQITIRLNPPELGSVQVSIKEQGNQITGLLEVSEMQTRAEIQQTLPQIVRNLQDMGINVKRLDVTLTSEQDHHASMGQSAAGQHENWAGPDGSRNGGAQAQELNWLGKTDWLGGSNGHADGRGAYGSYVTDTSINMLV